MVFPNELQPSYYFRLENALYTSLFVGVSTVWESLHRLNDFVRQRIGTLEDKVVKEHGVYIHPTAVLSGPILVRADAVIGPHVVIEGPVVIDRAVTILAHAYIGPNTYVGERTEIRPGAFIRGDVYIGSRCQVRGEVKHSVFMDDVHMPHYSYAGDSIVGMRCNLAAGSILSNSKNDKSPVRTNVRGQVYDTGLAKMGAILGDDVKLGCNVVTNPGTLIGMDTLVYGLASIRGFVPTRSIVKYSPSFEIVPKR